MFSLRVEGSYFRGWSQQNFHWDSSRKNVHDILILWSLRCDDHFSDVPKLMNHFMTFVLCHDKSEIFHFFYHQWKIQDFKILDLQKETLMWHSNFRFHAQLLGDCGQLTSKDEGPTAVVIRCVLLSEKKKIGHVRWELSMIVSATSRSPARKRTLGYEKNKKTKYAPSQCGCFQK